MERGNSLKFTFIVPVFEYAGSSCIRFAKCMDSLCAQTDQSFNVIVVHDGPNEKVRELVARSGMNAVYYSTPFKGLAGGSHGVSFALDLPECNGEFLCILNGDNTLRPTYIEDMYREDADMLLCMVIHRDNYDNVTSGTNFTIQRIDRGNFAVRTGIAKQARHPWTRKEQDYDFFAACRKLTTKDHYIEKILMEHN